MSAAPRLLDTKRRPAPIYKASPLYPPVREIQDEALNVVGAHSSAVQHRREFEDYDGQSDAIIRDVRDELTRRGLPYLANRLDHALHLDHKERGPIDRIWSLFSEAAEAGRQIVHAVERLFGRCGR